MPGRISIANSFLLKFKMQYPTQNQPSGAEKVQGCNLSQMRTLSIGGSYLRVNSYAILVEICDKEIPNLGLRKLNPQLDIIVQDYASADA